MTVQPHAGRICQVVLALQLGCICLHLHLIEVVKQRLVHLTRHYLQEGFRLILLLCRVLHAVVHIEVSFLHELDKIWLKCRFLPT